MLTVIRKQPRSHNLANGTISINQTEYDIITNDSLKSEIHIFDEENNLKYKIDKKKYSKLIATPKTVFDEDGVTTALYIVDFLGAIK